MNRAILLSLMIYGLLVGSMLTLHGELLMLIIPLGLFLLVGYWLNPEKVKLQVTRQLSTERALPDAPVEVVIAITNQGDSIEEVLFEDKLPAGLVVRDGSPRSLVRLSRGATHEIRYSVSGPRGGYEFDSFTAQINDGLGLTRRRVESRQSNLFFVFPAVTRLRQITIRPRKTRVYAGSIPARAGGAGIEFFGVRGYQLGDSSRAINWRISARHAEDLFSNEFQQERVADVGIILDGRLRTNTLGRGHSLFEHSVAAAASLADAFLFQGNRVGLLLYANFLGWTLPAYGRVQRERILQALARAQPGDSQVFTDLEHIPTGLFPPESQLVVVSPLIEEDVIPLRRLRAMGYQVMVISPDPVDLELSYLKSTPAVEMAARVVALERTLLLRKLRGAGIQILDWNVNQPLDLAIQYSLGRPPGWHHAMGGIL